MILLLGKWVKSPQGLWRGDRQLLQTPDGWEKRGQSNVKTRESSCSDNGKEMKADTLLL